MQIFGDSISGNCHKIRFTADFLGLPYSWEEVNLLEGETRTPEFLSMNPAGQVPFIRLDDGQVLAQSNAILLFLAEGSSLVPDDAYDRALVHQWLFWEQYSHEPYIAVLRFHMEYLGKLSEDREAWRVERGEQALDLMELTLKGQPWFVGRVMTVADVALVAYTRLAHEGGFSLAGRPHIRSWIERCEAALGVQNDSSGAMRPDTRKP